MYAISAFIIGLVAGIITALAQGIMEHVRHINDACVCVPVYADCGFWGLLATGLFGARFLVLIRCTELQQLKNRLI